MAVVGVDSEGTANHILAVTAEVMQRGGLSMDPETLLVKANEWNGSGRWPRAFVKGGKLLLDYHVDLEKGVTEDQLRNFLFSALLSMGFSLLDRG